MTSRIYVGKWEAIRDEWCHPISIGCPHCSLSAALLITTDEYPLDWTKGQRAIAETFLQMKYPDSHNCEEWP